jgi:hypothetical protein
MWKGSVKYTRILNLLLDTYDMTENELNEQKCFWDKMIKELVDCLVNL